MNNQLEAIRQLKGRGMSIRDIADKLSISKYEVEKAFLQLKALPERPDANLDGCLDEEPDNWPDSQTPSSRQNYSTTAISKSPKDLPSEWHNGVTRFEADFIVASHIDEYEPVEIKALYESKYPQGYISLNDVRKVVQAYEQEEAHQNTIKAAGKKAKDEQIFRQFTNFVGEDVLAFLLWVSDVEEWETAETKSCVARASTLISELERFCRTNKLAHKNYEPFTIINAIKDAMNTSLRKRDDPEFDDNVFSFLEMLRHRPSLDRYFWKMFESSTSYSRW